VVRLNKFQVIEGANGAKVIAVTDVETLGEAKVAVKAEAVTPAPAKKPKLASSPPSHSKVLSQQRPGGSRRVQPIASLNPYNNNWTVRARVQSKGELRTYTNAKGEGKVFHFEIVDEQGGIIEVTAWHDLAAKYHAELEEGKVYYFSRGQLKPANKKFSSVRNDYSMTLGSSSKVEECLEEVDAAAMRAKLEPVPIDQLALHIGRKALVDVVGVVTEVQPLGSIKRRSDNTELVRRDITLVDASKKTVTLTLWARAAEEEGTRLESMTHPVLAVSGCKVGDYNGVSLGTVSRSRLEIEPELPAAAELRSWYQAEGASATFTHAGEGLASALKSPGQGRSNERVTLFELQQGEPQVGAKPEWHNVKAMVKQIKSDQTLYYLAAPDGSNKKVREENGMYWCEGTQKHYSSATRRYIMRCAIADAYGTAWVNLFNDQAEQLLGMKADDIAKLKEGGEQEVLEYERVMKAAQATEWTMRVSVRAEEYQGEARRRIAVQSMGTVDFAKESGLLVNKINALLAPAA